MTDFNARSTIGYLHDSPEFEQRKKGWFGKEWFNVQTGNPIKSEGDLRINLKRTSVEQAVDLFHDGDFTALFQLPRVDSGPLHIDWANSKADRLLLIQLRLFTSSSSLDPITDVVEVRGADYDAIFGGPKR